MTAPSTIIEPCRWSTYDDNPQTIPVVPRWLSLDEYLRTLMSREGLSEREVRL